MKRSLPLLIALTIPGAAWAQWTLATESAAQGADPLRVAKVTNPSGHSLRVYRDADDVVWAEFALRDSFDTIHETSCPTYRVDQRRPVSLPAGDARCRVEPRRARYQLGTVEAQEVHSPLLLQLMNGSEIVFRYQRNPRGYEETRFTLARSKHALASALGAGVDVYGD